MLTIEAIGPTDVAAYQAARLAALQESPEAFGSTYAAESQLTPAEWERRTSNFCTASAVGYLARDGQSICGLAGCFIEPADPLQALLVSMWVDPGFRRSGVGQRLIEEVSRWAAQRGAKRLKLQVTETNHAAIAFYRRLGFAMTGESEPYPNDPALVEWGMAKPLAE